MAICHIPSSNIKALLCAAQSTRYFSNQEENNNFLQSDCESSGAMDFKTKVEGLKEIMSMQWVFLKYLGVEKKFCFLTI